MKRLKWMVQIFGHRYFNRILILCGSALIIIVVIASASFYWLVNDIVTKKKYESDMQMLMQLERNFHNSNSLMINFTKRLYEDPFTQDIMYHPPDDLAWDKIAERLQSISANMENFSPNLHSVYIYNHHARRMYSVSHNAFAITKDLYLERTLQRYDEVPKLQPILRKIKSDDPNTIVYEDVLSYIYYKDADENGRFEGAVIVNVYPDFLLSSLSTLNSDQDSQFLLMASSREYIGMDTNLYYDYLDDMTMVYFSLIRDQIRNGVLFGMIPNTIHGEESIVSFIYLEKEDFILYKIQSHASVYQNVNRFKSTLYVISSVIIVLSMCLAVILSDNIYKPFDKLIQSISQYTDLGGNEQRFVDELGFLENSYVHGAQEIAVLKEEIHRMDTIKYKYYLTQLLVNSKTVTQHEIDDINHSGLFSVRLNHVLSLVILKLGAGSIQKYAGSEINSLFKQHISDALNSYCIADVIDLENGYIVAIISTGHTEPDKETLITHLREFQRTEYQNHEISFAAIISDAVHSVHQISEVYTTLRQYLSYTYIFGTTAIITSDLIEENIQAASLNYPFHDEKKLIDRLKEQNFEKIVPCLDAVLLKIKKMNYNNVIISAVHLSNTIRETINEINRGHYKSDVMGLFEINPTEYQTIDELRNVLLDRIKDRLTMEMSDSKQHQIIKAVECIVKKDYSDPNLNLNTIADRLKVSPNYLNTSFRELHGCSIWDYIMDHRLNMAVGLLEASNDSVKGIMGKVGIDNESTFFRCFKAKFGMTPKHFLAQKIYTQSMGEIQHLEG